MVCASARFNNLNVRVTEKITCTITPRNDANQIVAVDLTDFGTPAITGGSLDGQLAADSGGGTTVVFDVVAPASITAFDVTGKDDQGTSFTGSSKVILTMVGTPTAKSELACVGGVSQTKSVRKASQTDCTITIKDNLGTTTGLAEDFQVAAVGAAPGTLTTAGNKATVTFSATAPSAVGTTYIISAQLKDGPTDLEDPDEVMTVVGLPTVDSLLSCSGDVTKQTTVRESEQVTCIIFVKDETGFTSGFASDFLAPIVVGGGGETTPETVDGESSNYRMKFTVGAPAAAGDTFSIRGRIAAGAAPFTQAALNLPVGKSGKAFCVSSVFLRTSTPTRSTPLSPRSASIFSFAS